MSLKEINLTKEQKKIVELSKGKHIVLAPPGTGKTELIAQRVDYALSCGVSPKEMLCLTFTNRAARGMKERIEERHPDNGVFIGNIHKFCFNFLKRNKIIPQMTSLLDEEDAFELMREVLNEQNIKLEGKAKLVNLIDYSAYLKQAKLGFKKELIIHKGVKGDNPYYNYENICNRYEELKEESMLIDFDDMLTLTYDNLRKNPCLCGKYSWVQVDEVQDLNPLQWEIIKHLAKEDSHQVYFGDTYQAIFSFMGAKLENLEKIESECVTHYLKKNFRSPSYLLDIFNDFASVHFLLHDEQKPFAEREEIPGKEDLLIIHFIGSEEFENDFIANSIVQKLKNISTEQTAILVRTNKTADAIAAFLDVRGENYFKISGHDLFRRALVKDILAFLFVLNNKSDKQSWMRLFTIFGKMQSLKSARKLLDKLFDNGFIPTDLLEENMPLKTKIEKFSKAYKNKRIVVFDTETTGLKPDEDDIIQIAAVEIINGEIGREFEVFLKTDKSLEKTEKIHKISKSFLDKNGLNQKEGLIKFKEFVGNDILVAHNLKFDWNMLKSNLERSGLEFDYSRENSFDTLDIARRTFYRLKSYKLGDLLDEFNLEGKNSHNALDDVKATANLIEFLAKEIDRKTDSQLDFLVENSDQLLKFHENFYPYWQKAQKMMNLEYSLDEVVYDFLRFYREFNKNEYEKREVKQLDKLLTHMRIKCKRDILKELLKKHINNYRYYKEADLIIGDEKVVVSTIHKAKGLEFENVIIPGCVSGVYPFRNYYKNDDNEDLRVFYVALTRAKKRIIITTHSYRKGKFGRTYDVSPSYFFNSIENHFNVYEIYEDGGIHMN